MLKYYQTSPASALPSNEIECATDDDTSSCDGSNANDEVVSEEESTAALRKHGFAADLHSQGPGVAASNRASWWCTQVSPSATGPYTQAYAEFATASAFPVCSKIGVAQRLEDEEANRLKKIMQWGQQTDARVVRPNKDIALPPAAYSQP